MQGLTISSLQAYTGPPIDVVYIESEPRQGFFRYDALDTTSPDDGNMVLHDFNDHVYKRDTDFVTPEMFGAAGDGLTDDTDAIQDAINFAILNLKSVIISNPHKVSRQGSVTLPGVTYWGGNAYYCLLINNTDTLEIVFKSGGKLMLTETNYLLDRASLFVINGSSDIAITGFQGEGFGFVIGTGNNRLFNGAAVCVISSRNILIRELHSKNLNHGVITFSSSRVTIRESLVERATGGNFTGGAHIGLYSSSFCLVDGNTTYGGTLDGDIGALGTADSNKIINNFLYAYEKGDASKTISYQYYQGIFSDSAVVRTVISNNYLYGYFYGIDAKTLSLQNIVSNNIIHKCTVGITSRFGEGGHPNGTIIITGNQIIPDGGNYSPLPSPWITDVPIGILLHENFGAIISNNTIENSHTISGTSGFVGIQIIPTNSMYGQAYLTPTVILGNSFVAESGYGNKFQRSLKRAIVMYGSSESNLRDISIIGNTFKGIFGSTATEGYISANFIKDLKISSNIFTDTRGYYLIRVQNSTRVTISDNNFGANAGLLLSENNNYISFCNNISDVNIKGTLPPYTTQPELQFANTKFITVSNNVRSKGGEYLQGRYLAMSGNSDWLVATGNNLEFSLFSYIDYTNWYTSVGTNNLIKNNLVNGVSPDNQGNTLVYGTGIPASGTFKIADKIQYTNPVAGGYEGLMCTVEGTLGTLSGITGDISSGTNALTVSDATTLSIGQFITIAGVSGKKQITAISGGSVTLNTNADATVSLATVQFSAPTFKQYGRIEA